jgi:iron-sulfur cluster repair protein YtfE (RIC family)
MPRELLDDPLEFFTADHLRQRAAFTLIEQLAGADTLDRGLAVHVLDFLEADMVAHVLDEEDDLFPLLRRQCEPEDDIEHVLGDLSAEHSAVERTAVDIRSGLAEALKAGCAAGDIKGLGKMMIDFAQAENRHLALENGIVLPLARVRLTQDDLRDLSGRMKKRRTAGS